MRRIAIEGCIGAGKTTLARNLSRELGIPLIEEASHLHPFLEKFYTDPAKFALETELAFLLIHFHQLLHAADGPFVADFTIYKDALFARMNLNGDDLACFEALYQSLEPRLIRPQHVILLDAPPDVCASRIKSRGRPEESNISENYLGELRGAYLAEAHHLGHTVTRVEVNHAIGERELVEIARCIVESNPRGLKY